MTSFWCLLVLQSRLKLCFLKPLVVLKPCLFEKALFTDIIFRKIEREREPHQMGKVILINITLHFKRGLHYKAVVISDNVQPGFMTTFVLVINSNYINFNCPLKRCCFYPYFNCVFWSCMSKWFRLLCTSKNWQVCEDMKKLYTASSQVCLHSWSSVDSSLKSQISLCWLLPGLLSKVILCLNIRISLISR